jgi:pimeloyl-ACP methyl ester carboxylesterase
MPTVGRGDCAVYYERWAGPADAAALPVFLIPGLAANAAGFHELVVRLRVDRDVLSIDNRGAGRTGPTARPFSMADLADDVAAVLDAERVEVAHIVGTSMGGMIAQELALRHSARVATLTLACTSCGGRPAVPPNPRIFTSLLRVRILGGLVGVARPPVRVVAAAVAPILFAPETDRAEHLRFILNRAAHPATLRGSLAQIRAIRDFDTHDRLGQITAPTLVVTGRNDVLIPPQNSRILASRIPGAQHAVMAGGHVFFFEHEAEFKARLDAFWGDRSVRIAA